MLRALLALAVLAAALAACASGTPARTVPNRAFPSAADPEAPAVLWAVGDGADGGAEAKRLVARIRRGRPDRLLYLGDVYEEGSPAEYRRNYDGVYGALAHRTAPTPGNHEWPEHTEGYDPYWRRITGAPTPPWYTLRIGGWQVYSLNSEAAHDAGSPQLAWLRRQVRAHAGTCALAFWHRPRYSSGPHGDQPDVQPFWDALAGHAALVLNGHDHDLQRFTPRRGITEIVDGAGGRGHYALAPDGRQAFADDTHYGALRLALEPGQAVLATVASNGRVLDRDTVTCGD